MPEEPQMFRAEVLRSERLTPSMQRVTVGGDGLAEFRWMGYDHWFRLFMQRPRQAGFVLPETAGTSWWKSYMAMPEEDRPYLANYTVADYREDMLEMDIDFVVHRGPSGAMEGGAAIWACGVTGGEPLGVLDQGVLFDRPDDASEVIVVADESGLPAVAGILRSLPRHVRGRVIQEIPLDADRRALDAPDGVEVTWVSRKDHGAIPGAAALEELRRVAEVSPSAYGFVVGESGLATGGRRHLHRCGVPKDRITFSGFWKHTADRKHSAH